MHGHDAGEAAVTGTTGGLTLLKYLLMTKFRNLESSAWPSSPALQTPLIIQHRAEVIKMDEQAAALRGSQNEELARLTGENQRLAQLVAQARSVVHVQPARAARAYWGGTQVARRRRGRTTFRAPISWSGCSRVKPPS